MQKIELPSSNPAKYTDIFVYVDKENSNLVIQYNKNFNGSEWNVTAVYEININASDLAETATEKLVKDNAQQVNNNTPLEYTPKLIKEGVFLNNFALEQKIEKLETNFKNEKRGKI